MTDTDEKLIENSMSRFGLRTLDIIRYGKQVDLYPWLDMVPGEAKSLMMYVRKIETELGIHHLIITWNARELVEYENKPLKYGVLWWIGEGERTSKAIDMAASLFKIRIGRYPTKGWMKELPKNAPDSYAVEGIADDPPEKPIVLRMAGWVPEGFVCVGIEKVEAEIEFRDGKYSVRERVENGK